MTTFPDRHQNSVAKRETRQWKQKGDERIRSKKNVDEYMFFYVFWPYTSKITS